MKKLLIITVSSLATLSGIAHATSDFNSNESAALRIEIDNLVKQASTKPASSLYTGDFQEIANATKTSQMYTGIGSKKMITTTFLVY